MDFLLENNVNYSINLFRYATKNKIPFIYASSAATYGMGDFGFDDNHEIVESLTPLNPYAVFKNNFDKLVILIDDLLYKNKILTKNLNSVYVNRGPGSFAGIRSSISIAKGYHISKNIDYYCFSFLDFINQKRSIKNKIIKNPTLLSQYFNIEYEKIPELCNKYKIKKNLIKPLYLS